MSSPKDTAALLRQLINEKFDGNVRETGRALNPQSPEAGRTSLNRWLRGKGMDRASALALSRVFERPPTDFRPERAPGSGSAVAGDTLAQNLESVAALVERLATTVRLLAEAQRPALRRQLLHALDGESQ